MKASAGRVLMLVENRYPSDVRVKNEAQALRDAGWDVSVVALARKGQKRFEVVDGVRVYRLPEVTIFKKTPLREDRGAFKRMASKLAAVVGYSAEYAYFSLGCLTLSLWVALRRGFDVVHAHNPPDTLFLVGAVFKPFGKKFVFDHHDLSPELYLARLGQNGASAGVVHKALMMCERFSLRLADVSIATNESYKGIQVERGAMDPNRVFVVRNGPDLNRLRPVEPDPALKKDGRKLLVYVGYMNPQDGIDYLLRSLHHLVYQLGRRDFRCVNVGTGDSLEDMRGLCSELQLDQYVRFTGYVSEEDLIRYLSSADICLDPNPSNPLNDFSTWIKVMEYMAFSKPTVSFDLKETRYSAQGAALYVPANDEAAFAQAIARLMDDEALRRRMGEMGRRRVKRELEWSIVSKNLLAAYERLGGLISGPGQASKDLQAKAGGRPEGASREEVIVISGLPRSGTSMMMKMLEAAGVEVVSDKIRPADEDNPKGYFEYEPVKELRESEDKSWVRELRGRAVKVISRLLPELPSENRYKVIFMNRHLDEVLASQAKMLARRGKARNQSEDGELRRIFAKHLERTRRWLADQANFEVLCVDFGDVLSQPLEQARRVADFLEIGIEPERMAGAVDAALYRNRAREAVGERDASA